MNYHRIHKARSEAASKRARLGWVKRHAAMATREPSDEDSYRRAINDRRGEVFATLQTTNHATGKITRIVLHHSLTGRSDQFRVTVNGQSLRRPMGITEVFNRWKKSII